MATDFDAVVIGSGFGGAVVCCRLAEAGYKVLVLERGRRWDVKDYPRKPEDAWIWDHNRPDAQNGWIDMRIFPNMTVLQGAAVGGGSLIYANISVNAKEDLFKQGWPPEINYNELKPYYSKVGQMMNVQPVPTNQWPERTKLMKEAADKAGYLDRFQQLDLAVTFDPNWHYGLPNPHDHKHAQMKPNAQGVEQGTCVHLGDCDIGCPVKAKNTLDLNYIPAGEKKGAQVRPLHLVRSVEQISEGYRVHFDRIENGRFIRGSVTGRLVIVCAGSLGSTELLLRCKEEHKTLPNLSAFLGRNWSSNGDFLTPAYHPNRKVLPTRGPTITAAIDFLGERNLNGNHFFIEDGGFPDVLGGYLEKGPQRNGPVRLLLQSLQMMLSQGNPIDHIMPWFAQGRDAADGLFSLRRRWWLFGEHVLDLKWDIRKSEPTINAIVDMHKKLAHATGGTPLVPLTWTVAKDLITPHPLGGCNMGTSPQNGVVNHMGEVFGYRNLYVADAAIIPEAIGANPSKTIAALAERIAQHIASEGR